MRGGVRITIELLKTWISHQGVFTISETIKPQIDRFILTLSDKKMYSL